MHLLVIGGSGLIGRNVCRIANERGFEVTATYNTEQTAETDVRLDKTDAKATRSLVEDRQPDAVIDTAAFHAVDDCEHRREQAWTVNAAGTRNAAAAAEAVGARYVYLSTDYVFPGRPSAAPYAETDDVGPINYYARTKFAGETAAQLATRATVLRTSVVYGTASDNFITWAMGELDAGNRIDIVDDQVSRPTYAPDVAKACVEMVADDTDGLYHAAGPVSCSRYEFTRTLADTLDYDTDLVAPISTEEFGQDAPRPADSSLDSSRLYDRLGWEFDTPDTAFTSIDQSD